MDRTTSNNSSSASSTTSAGSQNPHLGVNKLGRSIRKATPPPPPQPQPAANRPPQPQPQVYNISKNQFRDIVQQLTAGTPSPPPPQH